MLKSFWTGFAIGVPAGMLLADLGVGRVGTSLRRRGLELVHDGVQQLPGNAGRNLADVVERQIDPEARRREHQQTIAADVAHHDGQPVRLNSFSREELLKVYGIGPVTAQKILDGRPYRSDHEVVDRGIISEHTFQQLQRELLD